MRRPSLFFTCCLLALCCATPVFAAKIGNMAEVGQTANWLRFFSLRDPAVRYALVGAVLLGMSCGLFGSFLVVRRMALVGDALSHAVLPGVVAGFLWQASKDPVAILVGATIAGLLGSMAIQFIVSHSRLKEDAAIGMVLASFFALGITMMTMIQRLPIANKSGLNHFLFGQVAALSKMDLQLMAVVSAIALICIVLLYKEFLLISFDALFAGAIGLPVKWLNHLMMFLLAMTVVIALQAVGVVLVSAMLITPAAAAYLFTKRLHHMLIASSSIGIVAGVLGAYLSFLAPNLPTGPLMVLSAALMFGLLFFFAPRHGMVMKWWKVKNMALRTRIDNALKAFYHVREAKAFVDEVLLVELEARRGLSAEVVAQDVLLLARQGLVTPAAKETAYLLTPEGWRRACAIIRNHRLWELYLNLEKHVPADQVHAEAEEIEHVLGEDVVRRLEKLLKNPQRDPHGRLIPSLEDVWSAAPAPATPQRPLGYFGKGS